MKLRKSQMAALLLIALSLILGACMNTASSPEATQDPFTGAVSNDGFWERYGKALARTDAALAAFDRDDFDVEAARAITGDLDFSGEPTTARIVAVEDGAAGGRAGNERAEGASGAGSGRAAGTAGVGEGPAGTGAPGPTGVGEGPAHAPTTAG